MENLFIIQNVETGKLNDLVNNIMKQTGIDDPNEAVLMVNTGEVKITKTKWTEKDGVIRFSVTSDGTTGEQWIAILKSKGFSVDDDAESVLRSKSFVPTTGITFDIAVLKSELFRDNKRITKNIRMYAKRHKFTIPNSETACLIREKFTDEELEAMGLHKIVVMHKPIRDSDGDPSLLSVNRHSSFYSWMPSDRTWPNDRWNRGSGFAFVVSQVSSF